MIITSWFTFCALTFWVYLNTVFRHLFAFTAFIHVVTTWTFLTYFSTSPTMFGWLFSITINISILRTNSRFLLALTFWIDLITLITLCTWSVFVSFETIIRKYFTNTVWIQIITWGTFCTYTFCVSLYTVRG